MAARLGYDGMTVRATHHGHACSYPAAKTIGSITV
jgi:hypothetical protein